MTASYKIAAQGGNIVFTSEDPSLVPATLNVSGEAFIRDQLQVGENETGIISTDPSQDLILSPGSAGNLLIGKTTADTTSAGFWFESVGSSGLSDNARLNMIKGIGSGTGSTTAIAFYYSGTEVGNISTSSTATAFNTASDERLKINIVDAPSASSKIDAIRICSFNFKSNNTYIEHGVIAQELYNVVPEAVHVGGEDANTDAWAIDYSKLIPMLLKEIQELRARVNFLESHN